MEHMLEGPDTGVSYPEKLLLNTITIPLASVGTLNLQYWKLYVYTAFPLAAFHATNIWHGLLGLAGRAWRRDDRALRAIVPQAFFFLLLCRSVPFTVVNYWRITYVSPLIPLTWLCIASSAGKLRRSHTAISILTAIQLFYTVGAVLAYCHAGFTNTQAVEIIMMGDRLRNKTLIARHLSLIHI